MNDPLFVFKYTNTISFLDRDPRGLLERSWSESSNSTILLSTSELEKLIEDANESLDDMTDSSVSVVILHKENEMQGLGLTVSGGIDQEKKEIMVSQSSPSPRRGVPGEPSTLRKRSIKCHRERHSKKTIQLNIAWPHNMHKKPGILPEDCTAAI